MARRGVRAVLALAVALGSAVAGTGPAAAAFARTASSDAASFAAATLQPASNLSASPNGSTLACAVHLSWTASPSTFRNGYRLQRSIGSTSDGSPVVLGPSATSYTDSVGISLGTSYTWRLTTTSGTAWTSAPVSVTRTVSLLCL